MSSNVRRVPKSHHLIPNLKFPARLASILLAATVVAADTAPSVPASDAHRFLEDIKSLTAPAMEGRGDGSKGLTRAARLLEQRYKSLGLQPAGTNGYLQPFRLITGAKLKGKNDLVAQSGSRKSALKLNQDFVPFSFSASGSVAGRLVFVGYGASASEFGYDDYAGIDVQDKIVVVLRYEPTGFAAKSGNNGLTIHSQLVTKAINARNRGAKAVVLANGKLGDGEEDLLTRFGSVSGPENVGICIVHVKNAVAEDWFKSAGKSLSGVQNEINQSTKPDSFEFPETLHVALDVGVESTRATVSNVLAYLPGRTDEYVILGAHYDHLGRGNYDSLAPSQIGQIHPGADDNASGTAGVLLLVRAAQRLSQTVGYLGKNQCRFRGATLGCSFKRRAGACECGDEARFCGGCRKPKSTRRYAEHGWRRVRAVFRLDSGFWPNREWREVFRCEAGFACSEGRIQSGRRSRTVRRQADQEFV